MQSSNKQTNKAKKKKRKRKKKTISLKNYEQTSCNLAKFIPCKDSNWFISLNTAYADCITA